MMTPEKLSRILEGAEALIESTHLSVLKILIRRIAHRLKEHKPTLVGGADKNLMQTLQESGKLREEVEKEIAKGTQLTQEEVRDAFEEIGTESAEVTEDVYEAVGLPKEAVKTQMSPETIRVLERNYDVTGETMKNLSRTTADATNRVFIEEVDKAVIAMQTNNMSLTEAFTNACQNIAQNGITTVTYSASGRERRERVEVAVLRALRTTMAQTSAQIVLKRAQELNWDCISVSAHMGARTTKIAGKPYADHSSWQGKLYSLSGTDPELPAFYPVTGFGTGEGLCGYNCRHTINLGNKKHPPKNNINPEENEKRYALEQEQRRMERGIRKAKRDFTIWEEAKKQFPDDVRIDNTYRAYLKIVRKQMEEYTAFCKENGLRPLEERLAILHN